MTRRTDSVAETTSGSPTNASSQERLHAYFERTSVLSRHEREVIIPALAIRSYHLPGTSSYWKDWFSYLANNHPVFGICCHHPLHPVRTKIRVLSLFGSIAFGLAATNIIWLYFQQHDDATLLTVSPTNVTSVTKSMSGNITTSDNDASIQVTQSMLILWTLGGGTHALFDNIIWFVSACVCCLPSGHTNYTRWKRYKRLGTFFVLVAVTLSVAVASMVILLRVLAESNGDNDSEAMDDAIDLESVKDASSFRFLVSYCIELALALFVYYPIIAFVLFSGVIGCGTLPILGGRPYEMRQERLEEAKHASRDSTENEGP
ncbi:hypothetical protein MPSEU_000482100 [Mayamaea pseudoterrestris]|nr:hypothetical protein MPSEU_000482100 [Mayamaea pseudoterrestris]